MKFEDPLLQKAYEDYLAVRRALGRTKPVCLMDLATIAAKALPKARASWTSWTSPRRSTPAP